MLKMSNSTSTKIARYSIQDGDFVLFCVEDFCLFLSFFLLSIRNGYDFLKMSSYLKQRS